MSQKGFTNDKAGILANVAGTLLGEATGILSTKPTAKYASGARTTIKINNKIAAFAFSVSWTIHTEVIENRTIDDTLPAELIPNKISVEGTIGGFHIPGQGASALLIQSDVLGFLFHKYITIEVRDSATDNLLFYTNKAMITTRVETLAVEQLGTVQLAFKAIGWKDEREPVLPTGADNINGGEAEQSSGSRLLNKIKSIF